MADILMTAPMVLATLSGSKTQTRRIVKPQPPAAHSWAGWCLHSTHKPDEGKATWAAGTGPLLCDVRRVGCPYGRPGDLIRVRETFYAWGRWETRFSAKKGRDEWHFVDMTLECGKAYVYAADGQPEGYTRQKRGGVTPGWWKRPAIFMPAVASRLTLQVTAIRVERLRAISDADAVAEGIGLNPSAEGVPMTLPLGASVCRAAFRSLWESINGADSWAANPWVWVVSFKRLEGTHA